VEHNLHDSSTCSLSTLSEREAAPNHSMSKTLLCRPQTGELDAEIVVEVQMPQHVTSPSSPTF
jgi:hypothetical protein